MTIALCGLACVLDTYTGGFINLYIGWFAALALTIYGLDFGLSYTILAGIGATLAAFFVGLPETIFLIAQGGLTAVFIVYAAKKKWSFFYLYVGTVLISALGMILTLTVFSQLFGYENELAGLPFEPWDALLTVSLVEGLIEALCVLMLLQLLCMRLKKDFQPLKTVKHIQLSKPAGVLLIAGLILPLIFQKGYFIFVICYLLSAMQGYLYILRYFIKIRYIGPLLAFLVTITPIGVICGLVNILRR